MIGLNPADPYPQAIPSLLCDYCETAFTPPEYEARLETNDKVYHGDCADPSPDNTSYSDRRKAADQTHRNADRRRLIEQDIIKERRKKERRQR